MNEETPNLLTLRLAVPWRAVGLFFIYVLLHAAIFLHFGPQFLDDAYITFRYVERLAAGKGFTFNDGMAVLGTTTPLWTLLLALCRVAGMSLVFSVALLTCLSAAWLCLSTLSILEHFGHRVLGYLAGPALLVCVYWLWAFLIGMETVLTVAVTVAIMERIVRRDYRGVGLLGTLACLVRPEGVVIALLGLGCAAWEDRRGFKREIAIFALTLMPWVLYAFLVFGSPLPHSIAAKQVAHPAGFAHVLASTWGLIWEESFGVLETLLALVGILAVVKRRRRAWVFPVWIAAYSLGLASSGIMVFAWYLSPLIAVLWILGLLGAGYAADCAGEHLEKSKHEPFGLKPRQMAAFLQVAIIVAVVAQSSGFWRRNWREFPQAFTSKETLYLAIADGLRPKLPQGTKVFVGEVGVFAYALPQCEILDSSGINTPEILKIRIETMNASGAESSDDAPQWVLSVLREMKPDVIISIVSLIGGEALLSRPDLAKDYELVQGYNSDWGEVVVLKRKDFALR
ncbi:MAG: hypothetical protein V2A74_14160 [bacterium]